MRKGMRWPRKEICLLIMMLRDLEDTSRGSKKTHSSLLASSRNIQRVLESTEGNKKKLIDKLYLGISGCN